MSRMRSNKRSDAKYRSTKSNRTKSAQPVQRATKPVASNLLQELDPIDAHQSKKSVVPLFKLGLSELDFDGVELPL